MNKNTRRVFLAFGFIMAFMMMTPMTQAEGLDYQLLEKIPGTNGLGSNLPEYISAIYKIALIVVTLSAVLMLTVGGFMYLTSAGNTASMSSAKGIITDSIIGLIIALSAWLVLYIINPDLVKISMSALPSAETSSAPPATAPGSIGTLPSGTDSELAKKILILYSTSKITLNSSGSCAGPEGPVTPEKTITDIANGKQTTKCSNGCQTKGSNGCVEAINLSNRMLSAIVAVGTTTPFVITSVTGGSHVSDSSHYSGAAIDITPVSQALLDAFVKAGAFPPKGNASSMCEKGVVQPDGKTKATSVDCTTGGANHIHLLFPN